MPNTMPILSKLVTAVENVPLPGTVAESVAAGGFSALLTRLFQKHDTASQAPVGSPPVAANEGKAASASETRVRQAAVPRTVAPRAAAPQFMAPRITPAPQVAAPQVMTPQVTTPQISVPQITAPQVSVQRGTAQQEAVPGGPVQKHTAQTHASAGKTTSHKAEAETSAQTAPGAPGIVLTAIAGAVQALSGHPAGSPAALVPTPASGKAAAIGPRTWDGIAQKPAAVTGPETPLDRTAAPGSGGEAAREPDRAATPEAAQATPSKPDNQPDGPRALTEQAVLAAQSDPPPQMPSAPAAVPLTAPAQAQTALDQSAPNVSQPAPAEQIAPALVGLVTGADGTQSVTVRLQPADLGQVQIRVDQTALGASHVAITADRPETLELLQRDQPRLMQALDQAGVATDGRTVSFQVVQPEQVGATASRPDSMAAGAGDSGQRHGGDRPQGNDDTARNSGAGSGSDQGQTRTRWFRAGLDITA
jgi:flagellar hook-length control protein FliK